MKFSGVLIGSENAKALGEFYTQFLGKPGWQEGDWYGWQESAGMMIGSHSEVHGKNVAPARIMLTLEVEDVEAAYEKVMECGATSVAEPYKPDPSSDMLLATVADLDGNYVQLARPWK